MKKLLTFLFLMMTIKSQATIYIDSEEDAIPMVGISVIIPQGSLSNVQGESASIQMLGDMIEAGTQNKDRQKFTDMLGDYAAEYGFSIGANVTTWTLSFPYIEGKDYQGLIDLLSENWHQPRLQEKEFEVARKKYESRLIGTLDKDLALLMSSEYRLQARRELGLQPAFYDDLMKINLDETKKIFINKMFSAPDVWVGYVGPKNRTELVEKIVTTVFNKQGTLQNGIYKEVIRKTSPIVAAHVKPSKTFLLIDKPDRAQTVVSLMALNKNKTDYKNEIEKVFGDYLLVDNGFGALFTDEIRTKRGLAYSVQGQSPYYLGYPLLGFMANPQSNKTEMAFETIKDLTEVAYAKASHFVTMPKEQWDRDWKSFLYGELLEASTASGRLSRRSSLVTGDLGAELALNPLKNFSVSPQGVQKVIQGLWENSSIIMGAVGNPVQLRPLIQKYFPDYELVVIPYKEAIRRRAYP